MKLFETEDNPTIDPAFQAGFVFVTLVVMIMVLTMMVLSLMQSTWLQLKRHNQWQSHQQTFYDLDLASQQLTKAIREGNHICPMLAKGFMTSANEVLTKGCLWAQQYRYGVEDLGEDSDTLEHYLLLNMVDIKNPRYLLQVCMAKPSKPSMNSHHHSFRLLSWRYRGS